MSNIFSDLQQESATQKQAIEPSDKAKKSIQKPTQVSKRLSKLPSKRLSKSVSNNVSNLPTAEEVEELTFRLRKFPKVRINGDVPDEWKKRLDDLAHELGVGKYDLVTYVVAKFLGEV